MEYKELVLVAIHQKSGHDPLAKVDSRMFTEFDDRNTVNRAIQELCRDGLVSHGRPEGPAAQGEPSNIPGIQLTRAGEEAVKRLLPP